MDPNNNNNPTNRPRSSSSSRHVRFVEPTGSNIRAYTQTTNTESNSTRGNTATTTITRTYGTGTKGGKKVLIIHFGDEVKRIAYTEKAPPDAIEKSIRRECGLSEAHKEFSLLDSEGDSLVLDGSMEPGEVWLSTEQAFAQKVKKASTRSATPLRAWPDFSTVPIEEAIQHIFDPETGKWGKKNTTVKIDTVPFANGSLRQAFYMVDMSDPESRYVAKISIDPYEDRETYYHDVVTQMYACKWATRFNSYNPPKKVSFVMPSLVTLPNRPSAQQLWAVEKYIGGTYRKHNNNYGYVDDAERNTPQAFSHFTYEASDHKVMICDIQGVGDMYTDPQMHTEESLPVLGKGNLGTRGFNKFLSTHQCNSICVYLKLPIVNKKLSDIGTRPTNEVMTMQRIDIYNVDVYVSKDIDDATTIKSSSGPSSASSVSSVTSFSTYSEQERLVGANEREKIEGGKGCCCTIL